MCVCVCVACVACVVFVCVLCVLCVRTIPIVREDDGNNSQKRYLGIKLVALVV